MNVRGTTVALMAVALSACGSNDDTSAANDRGSAGSAGGAGAAGSSVNAGASAVSAATSECTSSGPDEPMLVTDACVDPRFNRPYVDIEEMRDTPVPHRYVHGGFTGTDARFSFYFPPADQYKGRFFHNTHQLLTSEDSADDATVGFALASGGYYVQTNLGGNERSQTPEQALSMDIVPAIGGYRVNAAAAKYSREKAKEIYGEGRIYGYLYGGSGGAYQTICSSEHSKGIWDGYLPFVMATPNAIPSNFTVRIHALRVLKQRNKFADVLDAIDPGGSGNPYAGLNEEEAGALREATRLGFPPRGWWNYATLNGGPLMLVAGYVPLLDPSYQDDFWSLPGYLGHDDPTGSVAAARIQDKPGARTVSAVVPLPATGAISTSLVSITLDSVPAGDIIGADLIIELGAGQTQQGSIYTVMGKTLVISGLKDAAAVHPGVSAHIDNSAFLALQTYHRHQVPTPDLYGWNSLRGSDGEPLYPQRDVLVGPIGAFKGAGCITDGHFNGQMIVVQNLMDIDAFPWQADWYRTKVMQALGADYESRYRLYFTDHAQHTSPGSSLGAPALTAAAPFARTIVYTGLLQHVLRDLSEWVEDGKPAPSSTRYEVDDDNQVVVPLEGRRGVQSVVTLTVNGGARAQIAVGQSVDFDARVSVPDGGGQVVQVEWDFEGLGDFPVRQEITRGTDSAQISHAFTQPGTYFPVVRVTTQREGDADSPYARVPNLGRVRVVVKNPS